MADENSIAIVGMAGHFPGARSIREYWSMLSAGRDATRWLSTEELLAAGETLSAIEDPNYIRATMPLPDMDMFDAGFFGFSPREAAIMDPQHRHFLECCWEALEDAGRTPPDEFDGAVGVFGGCGMQAYLALNLLTNPELVEREGMFLLRHTGNDKDFLTTRVSYLFNLHGPSIGIQTACSTSLVAIHYACQSLLSRECDLALAGGASINLPHGRGYKFAEGEILSSTGYCRAFDDEADGTLFGSGTGVVALRRLEDALRDGDNIHAVILGSAVNNDGARKAGYFAPSVDGQAMAAVEALAISGVTPDSVDYIEAHGTGTLVGDPIELSALQQVYGEAPDGSIGIGSVKTNIGHLDTAAGVASLMKVALALREEELPSTLNFKSPNSRFNFENSPFRVVSDKKSWPRSSRVRRASVNSLGVGGTNAHIVLEEAPRRPAAIASGPQIITFSARNKASLEGMIAKWRDFAADPGTDFCIANAAYTMQVGRKVFAHRAAVVASDSVDLFEKLSTNGPWKRTVAEASERKPRIVFMFPGGGAQHPNAGRALYERNDVFRASAEECFALLEPALAADLRKTMFSAEDIKAASQALEKPTNSLLAVFIVEYALSKLWESWGVMPDAVIGHSAGEYAAAVLAGVMSLQDAIAIVLERGVIFETAPPGGMVSVQDSEARVRELIGDNLDIAVLNSQQVTVVSGALEPLAEFSKRLEAESIKHAHVRIKVAAHSRMLDGGLAQFRARLEKSRLSPPRIEFINNLIGKPADPAELASPDYWVNHLRGCVRFGDGLSAALSSPDTILVEVGPGQALCALAGMIDSEHAPLGVVPTSRTPVEEADEEAFALTAFANLWTLGVPVDFGLVRKGEGLRRVSLPTYAFDKKKYWIEPGSGFAAKEESTPQIIRRQNIKDWFEARDYIPAPVETVSAQSGRRHVVFSDDSAFAEGLVDQLKAKGDVCTLVRHAESAVTPEKTEDGYIFNASSTDYSPLIEMLSEGAEPDSLIFLWPLLYRQQARSLNAFDAAFALSKALQLSGWAEGAQFISATEAGHTLHIGETADAGQAAVFGPWRMLGAEQSGVRSRVVDFGRNDTDEARIAALLAELSVPDETALTVWRDGHRYIPALRKAEAEAATQNLRERGVYLITGGLGGIGLELARYLAKSVRARLVLIGRSEMPKREDWARLAEGWGAPEEVARARELLELEAAGAEVLTLAADVSDAQAMAAAVAEARGRFGEVNGVFHGAGLIDDAPMAMKALESAHRVITPKADGAAILNDLFPDGSLDIFAVFSSTSVLIAPPGQSDYVASNVMAEAIAASRRDGRIITWSVWSDIGMAKRAVDSGVAGEDDHAHPLLGARQETRDGTIQFLETYSESSLWALGEHRIGDLAVLPGAAYVEIASAAALRCGMGDEIEISGLTFIAPLALKPRQTRHVRTTLTPLEDDSYRIEVESRGSAAEVWLLHFEARLARADFAPDVVEDAACDTPIAEDRLRLAERGVGFGPRWMNVTQAYAGADAVKAEFALADDFVSDLETYRVHPALFDTSFASGLFLVENDLSKGVFAPVSIESVRVHRPLSATFTAEARIVQQEEEAAVFDVDLRDTFGVLLLQIRGAAFRRVAFGGDIPVAIDPDASLRDRMFASGIHAQEAPEVFEHLFRQTARSVVISPVSMTQTIYALRGPAKPQASSDQKGTSSATIAAGDPVEQQLLQMCAEILGVETLGLDEEFLSYGGGSLTGVRLFARIRRELGVELALNALLQAPTIRTLAEIVRQQLPEDAQAASAEAPSDQKPEKSAEAVSDVQVKKTASSSLRKAEPAKAVASKSRWTPLVRMSQNAAGRKPLFLIHGAGGNVLWFKPFADSLKDMSPIYGIEAQGVDGTLPFLESIEEMAALYIRHMLTVDPKGPYRLVGYSGGGVIAVEMAHQLRRSGRDVELLVMLDTLAPQEVERPVTVSEKLALWARLSPSEIQKRATRRIKRTLEKIKPNTEDAENTVVKSRIELLGEECEVAYLKAQGKYHPAPYDGDVVLFRAERATDLFVRSGELLGWQGILTGKVEVITLDADHHSLLAEKSLDVLLSEMRERLSRLNAQENAAEKELA